MEVMKVEEETTVEEEVVGELPTGDQNRTLAQYIEMPATFNENGEMELQMKCDLSSGSSVTEIIFINVNEQNMEDDMIMVQEEAEEARPPRPKRKRTNNATSGSSRRQKRSKKQHQHSIENRNDLEEGERSACSYSIQTIFLTCSEDGCDLRFGDKKSRNAHLMKDHGVWPFMCPLRSCLEKCSNR